MLWTQFSMPIRTWF